MKQLLALSLAFFLLLVACSKEETTKTEVKKVTVDELASGLFEYDGSLVEVEGVCVHVCSHSGKKMFLVGDDPENRFLIFADEGIAGFPKELEGSKVSVIGLLEEEKLDMDYAMKLAAELADEMTDDPEHSCEFEEDMKKVHNLKERIKNSPNGYISRFTMTSADYKEVK